MTTTEIIKRDGAMNHGKQRRKRLINAIRRITEEEKAYVQLNLLMNYQILTNDQIRTLSALM